MNDYESMLEIFKTLPATKTVKYKVTNRESKGIKNVAVHRVVSKTCTMCKGTGKREESNPTYEAIPGENNKFRKVVKKAKCFAYGCTRGSIKHQDRVISVSFDTEGNIVDTTD